MPGVYIWRTSRKTDRRLSNLSCVPAQFLELVETRSALPDMRSEHLELRIASMSRESRKHIVGRAADSPRIREIPVNDLFESFHQNLFSVHEGAFALATDSVPGPSSAESHGLRSLSMEILGGVDRVGEYCSARRRGAENHLARRA